MSATSQNIKTRKITYKLTFSVENFKNTSQCVTLFNPYFGLQQEVRGDMCRFKVTLQRNKWKIDYPAFLVFLSSVPVNGKFISCTSSRRVTMFKIVNPGHLIPIAHAGKGRYFEFSNQVCVTVNLKPKETFIITVEINKQVNVVNDLSAIKKKAPTNLSAFLKAKRASLKKSYHTSQAGTQKDIALKSGVGLRFIRDIEQGKTNLQTDSVNQVLALFGYELGPVPIKREP